MATYTSKSSIRSGFAKKDFAPDGDLKKRVWQRADWKSFDDDWAGKRAYPMSRTRIASCWTPANIYFGFHCDYTKLNVYQNADPEREKYGLWERDVVEVFMNPDPARMNHYYEFEVSPNNLWIDLEINLDRKPFGNARWDSGYTHATHVGRKVWTCEMRIPIARMMPSGFEIRAGSEWRLNFFRADGQGEGDQRRLLSWSPTLTAKPNFHVPSRFGLVRFVQ
ncbi:MAG: carbohydrate-binding family 9-like protein [Terriglobia bacterium]